MIKKEVETKLDFTADRESVYNAISQKESRMKYGKKSYERQCFQECSYIFPSLFVILFFADPVWDGRSVYCGGV